MRKLICFFIASVFLFALAGCTVNDTPPPSNPDNKETSKPEPEVIIPVGPYVYEKNGVTYLVVEEHEMILVNKNYHLPPDYGDGITTEAQQAYDAMAFASAEAGYPIWIVSGFRSYELQKSIFENNAAIYGEQEANTFSARPGESEHQTGLAFDILGSETTTLTEDFADTSTFVWLEQNAADYGFIVRFLEGKTWATGYVYEPWHFRYVGVELAHIFHDSGLSVEEYAGLV